LTGKALLIFDVDGTIADTSPVHAAAFNEALAPLNLSIDYDVVAGMTTESAFQLILEEEGYIFTIADIERLSACKRSTARRLLSQSVDFMPGAGEFLHFARQRYRMAVCSSGSRDTVNATLQHLKISDMFDIVVTREDVTRPKPDPAGITLILRALGVDAQQAILFEDTAIGVGAGLNAGVDVVQISQATEEPPVSGVLLRSAWPQLLASLREVEL